MGMLQFGIEVEIKDLVSQRRLVDVYRLARLLREDFPDECVETIEKAVSRSALECGAAIYWNREDADACHSTSTDWTLQERLVAHLASD